MKRDHASHLRYPTLGFDASESGERLPKRGSIQTTILVKGKFHLGLS
jgi:hypothetical protein